MTVCVAAISQQTVVGATDRMLTSGDIEFEPPTPKVYALTDSACLMVAGDITLQMEIIHSLIEALKSGTGQSEYTTSQLADLYYEAFENIKRKRAARVILHPLGLTFSDINGLQGELALRLSSDILNFELPQIEALITGLDQDGPHIYLVDNGGSHCQDWIGFASIGSGANHANSQMIFAGHNRQRRIAETLFLVFSAKKRAEVAPGVGIATDMFFIEQAEGRKHFSVLDFVMDELQSNYEKMQAAIDAVRVEADWRMNDFVERMGQANKTESIDAESRQYQIASGSAQSDAPASEEPN